MGTLGVLLLACRKGYISSSLTQEKIDLLVQKHDMYVASNLLEKLKCELKSINANK